MLTKNNFNFRKLVAILIILLFIIAIVVAFLYKKPTQTNEKDSLQESFTSGCNKLKTIYNCVYQNVRDVSTDHLNSNGAPATLFELCQMKGISTGSACARECGC